MLASPQRELDLNEASPEKPLQIRVLVIDDYPVAVADILTGVQENFGANIAKFFDAKHGGDVRIVQDLREADSLARSPTLDYDLVFLDNTFLQIETHPEEADEAKKKIQFAYY